MEKSKTQKTGTNLRQMNTDDLLALVEAQASGTTVKNSMAQQQVGAVAAAVVSTVGNTLIDHPSAVPMMQPVPPQFAGMPPMPSKIISFVNFK